MFRVFFINFGWYSWSEGRDLEEAKSIAKQAGFQSRVEDPNGRPVGSWCPLTGWRQF